MMNYHLCILDVMLPLKDGFSLAEDIRKIQSKSPHHFSNCKKSQIRSDQRISNLAVMIISPNRSAWKNFCLRVEAILKRVYDRSDVCQIKNINMSIGKFMFDVGQSTNCFLLMENQPNLPIRKRDY